MNELRTTTAERVSPHDPNTEYWFKRNMAGYHVALSSIRPHHRVLDLGCGEGYGLSIIKPQADRCFGTDICANTVYHAAHKYEISAFVADVCQIALANESFDVILLLQVIEHLGDIEACLSEIRRVLRPGGCAWISTPNRLTYVGSPYHIQEFSPREFADRLKSFFTLRKIWGLCLQPEKAMYYQAVLAQTPAVDYWTNDQWASTAEKLPLSIRRFVPSSIKRFGKQLFRSFMKPEPLLSDDFFLVDQQIDESLDLIARLEKP